MFIGNVLVSLRRGRRAGANPWNAAGLEWSTSSPPPPYNFAVLPSVESRDPLWSPDARLPRPGYLLHHGREALGITPLPGEPDVILKMPEDSYAPFVLGVAAPFVFVGLLLHSVFVTVLARLICGTALLAWLWPRRELGQREPFAPQSAIPAETGESPESLGSEDESLALPVGSVGEHSGGWWGVLTLVVTEAALFGYLLFSFLYLASQSGQAWPPEGLPKLGIGGLNTAFLLLSSVFVWGAGEFVRRARIRLAFWSMVIAIVLGTTFVDTPAARASTEAVLRGGTPERPGAGVFLAFCAKCHGADGRGAPGKAPPLAGSELALAADPTSVLRLVIAGSNSPQTEHGGPPRKMPGFHTKLTDREIAQVVSFVRGAWGNNAPPIPSAAVTRLRTAIHR